ncbi:MAG: darcynin family protein [Polyangiaceae bacterium]
MMVCNHCTRRHDSRTYAEPMNVTTPPFYVFHLVRSADGWLVMSPEERNQFVQETLMPILKRRPGVRLRYFDAEAYSPRVTDVLMWEVSERRDYEALVEDLRETPFWGRYFEVLEILPCVEDGFARHYGLVGIASETEA